MKPCVLFFPTWDSPDLTLLLELLYYEAEFELNTTSGIVDQLQNILNSLSFSKDNIFEITDVDITTGKIILDYICIWISTKEYLSACYYYLIVFVPAHFVLKLPNITHTDRSLLPQFSWWLIIYVLKMYWNSMKDSHTFLWLLHDHKLDFYYYLPSVFPQWHLISVQMWRSILLALWQMPDLWTLWWHHQQHLWMHQCHSRWQTVLPAKNK